ncbi:calcium/sodium antiporter [Kaustia mangrovi]|uniref:Calcium/sodium antiporter n=1 Tax=Kaustia mangrovi TaxID=2593653 RepID=A0A7S8HD50_9HYPH|nr:calcium/sodium antiporter [Kaustia mangrovi]QPC44265.1 calcium/sodium antiporter [Kaustia mangrovi]
MIYVGLIAGFAVLLISGDLLVRGSVALALRLGVPAMIVGLTVVAFGTSAPELVVSLDAAMGGAPGIAIGNIVGSNIANVLLVLGIPALIAPTNCNQPFIRRNTCYVIAATLLFIGLCYLSPLGFWDGVVLFGLILLFVLESMRRVRQCNGRKAAGLDVMEEVEEASSLTDKPLMMGLLILLGLAGLPLGASLVVDNGSMIARNFGVPEAAIGLTLVALGTSLPELATTVAAALRGHCGVALGNVLGSNLFNILAIMGVTAMVVPVPVPEEMRGDLWIMLAATLVVVPFAMRRMTITRTAGAAFVVAYLAYIAFVFAPVGHETMAMLAH